MKQKDETMSKAITILKVENPHLTIRLYENLLKIDLKGSFKNEIEEALENKPVLKETVGAVLGVFVPLHIRLIDIASVNIEEKGEVKINLPLHRNVVLKLLPKDAEIFANKLKQSVSEAKKRRIEFERIKRKRARSVKRKSRKVPPSSYGTVPYYFPTEQVDIVDKLGRKRRRKK